VSSETFRPVVVIYFRIWLQDSACSCSFLTKTIRVASVESKRFDHLSSPQLSRARTPPMLGSFVLMGFPPMTVW
jgi:hypothetical protein